MKEIPIELSDKIERLLDFSFLNDSVDYKNRPYLEKLLDVLATPQSQVIPFIGAGITVSPLKYSDEDESIYPGWENLLLQLVERMPEILPLKIILLRHFIKRAFSKRAFSKRAFSKRKPEKAAYKVKEAYKKAYKKEHKGKEEYYVEYYKAFADIFSQSKLELDKNRKSLPQRRSLCEFRSALERMPEMFHWGAITTNYDRVIEYVYKRYGDEIPQRNILTPKAYLNAGYYSDFIADNKPRLIKLHGDVNKPDSIVLAVDEYAQVYPKRKSTECESTVETDFTTLLKSTFAEKCILFLGCSLEADRTLEVLYRSMKGSEQKHPELKHFAILPTKGEEDKTLESHHRLKEMGIMPIWYDPNVHNKHISVDEILEYSYRKLYNAIKQENE